MHGKYDPLASGEKQLVCSQMPNCKHKPMKFKKFIRRIIKSGLKPTNPFNDMFKAFL
jgi:hypothetical protein